MMRTAKLGHVFGTDTRSRFQPDTAVHTTEPPVRATAGQCARFGWSTAH